MFLLISSVSLYLVSFLGSPLCFPQGKWEPRRIPNPSFFEDKTPFRHLLPISAVGFELWTMSPSVFFDNLIVTSELAIANNYAKDGSVGREGGRD